VKRTVEAPPDRVWALVADPHNLPRWWPRTIRVEDVRGKGKRARWTQVLETDAGKGIRADYRCIRSTEGSGIVWEQELEGTPFERIVRQSTVTVKLQPVDDGTEVSLTNDRRLRGLSRLGSPMMRRAARRELHEAIEGLERALVE
jgi:uncharacterized protein YndB with AHSA1/START domain